MTVLLAKAERFTRPKGCEVEAGEERSQPLTSAPRADVGDGSEQLPGLGRIDDHPPVDGDDDLRPTRADLHLVDRVELQRLQLYRVLKHVVEHRPATPQRGRGGRRAIELERQGVEPDPNLRRSDEVPQRHGRLAQPGKSRGDVGRPRPFPHVRRQDEVAQDVAQLRHLGAAGPVVDEGRRHAHQRIYHAGSGLRCRAGPLHHQVGLCRLQPCDGLGRLDHRVRQPRIDVERLAVVGGLLEVRPEVVRQRPGREVL
ncbi:hypothetical protein [Luedemannella helvata]|uniref:hypothetical protein n=1 Tax=Luedemannella helvata TaxID=349315 RepID=UPI0031D2DEED